MLFEYHYRKRDSYMNRYLPKMLLFFNVYFFPMLLGFLFFHFLPLETTPILLHILAIILFLIFLLFLFRYYLSIFQNSAKRKAIFEKASAKAGQVKLVDAKILKRREEKAPSLFGSYAALRLSFLNKANNLMEFSTKVDHEFLEQNNIEVGDSLKVYLSPDKNTPILITEADYFPNFLVRNFFLAWNLMLFLLLVLMPYALFNQLALLWSTTNLLGTAFFGIIFTILYNVGYRPAEAISRYAKRNKNKEDLRRLIHFGQITNAKIDTVEKTNLSINQLFEYRVRLIHYDAQGNPQYIKHQEVLESSPDTYANKNVAIVINEENPLIYQILWEIGPSAF